VAANWSGAAQNPEPDGRIARFRHDVEEASGVVSPGACIAHKSLKICERCRLS